MGVLVAAHRIFLAACRHLSSWVTSYRERGLSCPAARGIFPRPGIEPWSPASQGGFSTTGHWESPNFVFKMVNCLVCELYLTLYIYIYTLIYLWLCWVIITARAFPWFWRVGTTLYWWCTGFTLRWPLLLQTMGSRAQVQHLWCTGLAAPRHVESSRIRDWTCVSCIHRWFLIT